jgi:holo-[acyl-carrier protein] synthase
LAQRGATVNRCEPARVRIRGHANMSVIGIGTHIIECLRIAQMIERHGELFLRRVYTQREIEHCSSRRLATQNYAAHWAAKEAVLKAFGTGFMPDMSWRDIEMRVPATGRPSIALAGPARELSASLRAADLMISTSYCRTHATAHAVVLGE